VSDVDDPIELAWSALLDEWESPERHKAFVALASSLQRLPDAARRYREGRSDPRLAERAKQGIDAVLRVAMLSLAPLPRRENEVARKVRGVLLPMSVAMALVVFTLMASQALHQPALASPWLLGAEVLGAVLVPWQKLLARDE
jgi:hypothetical protein